MNERSIFIEALNKTNAVERAAHLDAVCGEDDALRRRVEKLLAAHEAADGPLVRGVCGAGLLLQCGARSGHTGL